MGQRIKFLLSQFLWGIAAIWLLINANNLDNPIMVLMPMFLVFIINGLLLNWGSSQNDRAGQDDNVAIRALVTGFMWLIFVGAVIGGTVSIGAVTIPLAIIMMIPLLALSSFMWKTGTESSRKPAFVMDTNASEKRKRNRVDAMLRDLSDEDLLRLKQRLAYGDIEEEDLEYMLGDDGELVSMQERKRKI